MKNYYELLGVASSASADEIKRAFRKEIARYHPDKVQHLGQEFQQMAASRAAELTEAYRILKDPELRDQYDQDPGESAAHEPIRTGPKAPSPAAPPRKGPPAGGQPSHPPRPSDDPAPRVERGPGVHVDFVRKASLSRLRDAIIAAMPGAQPVKLTGFDEGFDAKPKAGLFKKTGEAVRILARFVPQVDGAAVAEAWPLAIRGGTPDVTLCVLLMGPGLSPAKELAAAVSEQRRRSRNAGPVLVPVDVRDWDALFPPDTPASVRSVIQRLREGQM